MISFTVYGTAEPAGSKRAFVVKGRAVVTDANARSKPWKQEVASKGAEAMNGDPLLDGPLEVVFTIFVPRPAGHFGKKGLLPSARQQPTVKPDLLKLARGIEDALTGVVWRDDSQIVAEHLFKSYGERAGVVIQIRDLSEHGILLPLPYPGSLPAIPATSTERIHP